jgi:Domain of unknown function (DUF4160)
MPTLARFARCKISLYPSDEPPPHFHLVGAGWAVKVAIGTWRVSAGHGRTADIGDAMAWAKSNESALRTEWERLNPAAVR